MANRSPRGTDFELEVAALYRQAGAEVVHNVHVDGTQGDITVKERTASGSVLRLYVECKDLKRDVDLDYVKAFITTMQMLRINNSADVGVLVSRRGFTLQAKDAATASTAVPIRLVPFADLAHNLQAPTRVVLADVEGALQQARQLCRTATETLRKQDRLTSFDLEVLHGDITKVLQTYADLLDRHRVTPPPNNEARSALSTIVRLEGATDQLLDALYYFRRADETLEEASSSIPPPGRTEADFAAAMNIHMRELEQGRAQLRFRINKLREMCDRLGSG